MIDFLNTPEFPLLSSSCLSQTQNNFHLKPINFKFKLCKIIIKVCFSTIFSLFHLDYVENFLGFIDLGIFEKRVGKVGLCQDLFKFLIGLCPICLACDCVDPMWQF